MTKQDKESKLLKVLVRILVETLPKHAVDCYGRQVHPSNRDDCCDCGIGMVRQEIRGMEL
jgi:hypothetical protein